MTIEKFLSFWSQHNIAIIESLIALVIIFSLFLAFRIFFAKGSKDEGGGAGPGLDTTQIEKALQKILENQGQPKASQSVEDAGVHADLDAMDSGSADSASEEVQQLRTSLEDSHKKIEKLQTQLQEAVQKASELAEASAAPAENTQETQEFKNKIRDLETRLSEYEIIAEDIADLSRYRDENAQLRKDLEVLKTSGGSAAAAPPVEAPVSAPAPQAAPATAAQPDIDAMLAEAASAPSPAPAEEASADLIDDELMKEFAAAVQGQKDAALDKAAQKAGDGSAAAAKPGAETDQLMGEFENFVSKKS